MLYTGKFKNVKQETIQVNIITNNNTSEEVELTFANESPVIIVQDSSDGIFSPIKSRSCTITIVSKDVYYDMYSSTSHGTKVTVNNLGTGECLFYGYLTPCEYNQSYLYLNEIELEAVDAVSTLHDFKYELVNAPQLSVRTIADIVVYCLYNIAGYTGGIYVPRLGMMMKKAWDNGFFPMQLECISEEIFKDDDDMLSCYEVLEEICNLYNVSLVPYGNDIYFVDYKNIKQSDYTNADIMWRDLRLKQIKQTSTSKFIYMEDYAGDDQNIEIDEVYNKITIEADVKEIEDGKLIYDPLDDMGEGRIVVNRQSPGGYAWIGTYVSKKHGNVTWTSYTRLFELIKGSNGGLLDTKSKWSTPFYLNCSGDYDGMYKPSGTWSLTDNFTNWQPTNNEAYFHWKWIGGNYATISNNFPAQCCLPSQLFNYKASEPMPYSADWDNMLLFFPQVYWLQEYYEAQENGMYSGYTPMPRAYDFWNNEVYEHHLGGTYSVLNYRGDTDIQCSPVDDNKTNWITFTGDLFWQQDHPDEDDGEDEYTVWAPRDSTMEQQHLYNGNIHPITELYSNPSYNAYTRATSGSEYNTGWPMLKITIKIGDKYWNGGTNINGGNWTTTPASGYINYHKQNVSTELEQLIWAGWNKPVTNHDFTYQIEKDAFAIPIVKSDNVFGKVSIDIFMPRIPYSEGTLFYDDDSTHYNIPWNGPNFDIWSHIYINHKLTPPCIFMKNLSMELISTDSNRNAWYNSNMPKKNDEDDDIIYSNTINTNNVTDFDDLKLKINTYNSKKPNAYSYLLEPGITNNQPDLTQLKYHTEGFHDYWGRTNKIAEEQIIARYISHYSTPKKIYNCQVHDYYEPWKCVHPNALKYNDLNPIYMIVDSQEYDVKADINELKLVEY